MTAYSVAPVLFSGISMVTATLGSNDPEVGTACRVGNADYLFVYNAGNSQIPPAYGVICSAVSGYSVTISSLTQTDMLMGVVKHTTLTTGTYGWVLTRGFTEVKMGANNSIAAAEVLALGTDGTFARRVSANTDIALGIPCGKAMSAVASGASGTAYVKTYF